MENLPWLCTTVPHGRAKQADLQIPKGTLLELEIRAGRGMRATEAKAPIDVVGTGSFLPQRWTETYATADIVEYDGVKRVKVGREFLFRK